MIIWSLLIFVFGLAIGSFLNVVILRLPKNQSLTGRSRCFKCRNKLGILELIPVLSFLALNGKCRHCGKKISWRYLIIELVSGILFVLAPRFAQPENVYDWIGLFHLWFFIAFAIIIFVVDVENFLILDAVVIPAAMVFLAFNLFLDFLPNGQAFTVSLGGLVGAFFGAMPFYLIWHFSNGRLMGFGDVKLMLPLGLFLGWPEILVGVFIAVVLGSLTGLFFLIFGKKTLTSPLPFGSFLALGALFAALFGQGLLHWYLSFLGI